MRIKLIILFVFVCYGLSAQYTDYSYLNQYCVVTSKTDGAIQVNEYILSGRVETMQNIVRVNNLNDVKNSTLSNVIPDLPDVGGEVIKDKLYKWDGQIIQCIQSHSRTEFSPDITPALFSFYRAETADMLWIPNEQVALNAERTYNAVKYKCIQAHMTQDTWRPDLTLGILWSVVVTSQQWTIGVAYKVNDIVTYLGNSYKCLQAHTSISTWNPVAASSLWIKI